MTAPEIGKPEDYIRVLDRGGYFEVTSLSEDDRKRNEMYQANLKREKGAGILYGLCRVFEIPGYESHDPKL